VCPFTVTPLTESDERLRPLTYPRYAPLVAEPGQARDEAPAWVARRGEEAVGLALASRTVRGDWRLMSIAVSPPFRRQGVGLALMREVTAWAAMHGTPVVALHSDRMRGQDAWLALLRRAGWPVPEVHQLRLRGRAVWARNVHVEWPALFRRLDATGFGLTPWLDRSDEDEATLAALAANLPEGMRPGAAPFPYPEASVVIREHGHPVGWVLGTLTPVPGEVNYPAGYVLPRLQRSGWLIGALVEVCRRQVAILGEDTVSSFETNGDNQAMQDFILRRLGNRAEVVGIDRRYASTFLPNH
jgi:GNAT superfamily N-acetyltransferase